MGRILHTRKFFIIGLIWTLSLNSAIAWTCPSQTKRPVSSTQLDATNRRAFFFASAVTAAVTLFPSVMSAKDDSSSSLPTESQSIDPFDAMSEALRQQGWPNSASPLPIPSNSSLGTSDNKISNVETPKAPSDFEAALQQASKKKQVDPRTHG